MAAGREQKNQFNPVHGRHWEPALECALGWLGVFRPDFGIFHPRTAPASSQMSSHSPSLHRGFFWLGNGFYSPGQEEKQGTNTRKKDRRQESVLQAKGENNIHLLVKQSFQGVLLSLRLIKQVEIPQPLVSRRYTMGMQSWDNTKTGQEKKGHLLWDMQHKYGLFSCVRSWRWRIQWRTSA